MRVKVLGMSHFGTLEHCPVDRLYVNRRVQVKLLVGHIHGEVERPEWIAAYIVDKQFGRAATLG